MDDMVCYKSYLPKKPDVVYPVFLTEIGKTDMRDVSTLFYSRKKVEEYDQLHAPQPIKANKIPDVKVIGKNVRYDAQLWRSMQLSSNRPSCYLSMCINESTAGGQQNLWHAGQLLRLSGTNFLLQVQAFLVDPDKTLSVLLVDGQKQVSVIYFIVFV